MFANEINAVAEAAVMKKTLFQKSKVKYLTAAIIAGIFIGFGMLLMSVIGGMLIPLGYPTTKLINGAAFAMALSLVVMAGAELFTGNNLVMTVGALEKKISCGDCLKSWLFAYIGNLIGSIIIAYVFTKTGIINEEIQSFILSTSESKLSLSVIELITRGILCNMLVCAAVWCSIKMKSESGKLIMIFWCIFTFVTCGFEHCVANMTLLSLGLLLPHGTAVSLGGFVYNLVFVTIGNVFGGMIVIACSYWYISKNVVK